MSGLFAKIRDRPLELEPAYWTLVVLEVDAVLDVPVEVDPVEVDPVLDAVLDPDTTVGATVLGNEVDDAVFDVVLVVPLVLGLELST